VVFNANRSGWRGFDRDMTLAEIVIREIERDRSLKVFQFLAKGVREPGQSASLHP